MGDNSTGRSHNTNHGFPEGVHVSMGMIAEHLVGYSKTVNPCPHNLKSVKFDVVFSIFISSSMETLGPNGCTTPNPTLWKHGTLEELGQGLLKWEDSQRLEGQSPSKPLIAEDTR
jgi:hypothetical protein